MSDYVKIPDLHDDRTVVEVHGRKYVRADKLQALVEEWEAMAAYRKEKGWNDHNAYFGCAYQARKLIT